MRISRTIKWISFILLIIVFLSFLYISAPYLLTSKNKLYEQGVVEMKKGVNYDVIRRDFLLKAIINFRVAMFKGYKERDIFINAYWCYLKVGGSHPWYRSIETIFTKGLKYYPLDIEFYCKRADARTELRKFKNALLDYDMAISLDNTIQFKYINAAYYQRGAIKYMLGDQIGAKADFNKAQEISDYTLREYKDYCKQWK